ncbi:unnamed protein product [Caretta caretta]
MGARDGNVAGKISSSIPAEQLSQIGRRRNRTWDGMFQEILQASGASDTKRRAWRITLTDSMDRDREEKSKGKGKTRATGDASTSQARNRRAGDSS